MLVEETKFMKRSIRSVLILFIFIASILTLVPTAIADEGISLSIPSLKIDAPVVEIYLKAFNDGSVTWDTSRLKSKIGHLEGTSWFGSSGNVVLGGHSELPNGRRSVFSRLHTLSVGEVITVRHSGAEYQYAVTGVNYVSAYDLSPIYPTSNERLTLITCDTNSYDPVTGDYINRVVVTADRVG
jgi:LPXTG-site transpeptidase (sortase) family protein